MITLQHGNTALHVTALQREACHVGDLMTCGVDPAIKNKVGCITIGPEHLFIKLYVWVLISIASTERGLSCP